MYVHTEERKQNLRLPMDGDSSPKEGNSDQEIEYWLGVCHLYKPESKCNIGFLVKND
jgi:hypothetical protein